MGKPQEFTDAQYLQHHLRSLIGISLSPASPAAQLIKDMPHASGLIGGAPQAWTTLRMHYYTEPKPKPHSELATNLFHMVWPKHVGLEQWRVYISEVRSAANSLRLLPTGDNDDNKARRAMWWSIIGSAPTNSPWFNVVKKKKTRFSIFDRLPP